MIRFFSKKLCAMSLVIILLVCVTGCMNDDAEKRKTDDKTIDTPTPTNTPKPVSTNTPTPTIAPTDTPTPVPTNTPTPVPTDTPTPTPTPTPSPTETPTPTPTVGPVAFSSLTTNIKHGSVHVEEAGKDARGYTHEKALLFGGSYTPGTWTEAGHFSDTSIEKYLGAAFSKFTAVIVPEETLDKWDKGCGAIVKIFADEVLVYTSPEIKRKSDEVPVEIDVTGVKYLKIQLEPSSDLREYTNEYDVLVCDAMLQ